MQQQVRTRLLRWFAAPALSTQPMRARRKMASRSDGGVSPWMPRYASAAPSALGWSGCRAKVGFNLTCQVADRQPWSVLDRLGKTPKLPLATDVGQVEIPGEREQS